MKQCIHCGQENDDAAPQCACGYPLVAEAASLASPAAEASPPVAVPVKEPSFILRKILFVVGTLALVAAYGLVRHRVKTEPLYTSLSVTGVWCATAVAGLWFLGREKRPMLRALRIAFLVVATCMFPVLLNIVDGLAEFGWPQGRFNRPIATILTYFIPLVASAFVTGLVVQLRTYGVAAVVSMLTGVASIVLGVFLIPATKSLVPLHITLGDVLNNVMFAAKVERYAAFPLGVLFVFAGILILLAARTRTQD